MGLNTKLVSGDGLDWEQSLLQYAALELPKPPMARRQQQHLQLSERLACPRCGSTNTKFCYYNNYNKSQPRHFCKACKRHWTKGGTLRNVPVGGGRKNKRLKASNTTTAAATSGTSRSNTQMGIQSQQQLALGDQKNISEVLYQALSQADSCVNNTCNFNVKSFSSNGNFLGSTQPLLQNQTPPFSFSSLSSSNPASIYTSFRSPDIYNLAGGLASMEDTTIPISSQPWQVPTTSSVMEIPNYWNWDDMDTFVPTELNIPWDYTEIKP